VAKSAAPDEPDPRLLDEKADPQMKKILIAAVTAMAVGLSGIAMAETAASSVTSAPGVHGVQYAAEATPDKGKKKVTKKKSSGKKKAKGKS